MRCLAATSVLRARESTAVLIVKASNSMNESFRLGLAKGPHCNSVHPTANAAMISATVPQQRQNDEKTKRVVTRYVMYHGAAKNHHSDRNRGKISQSCS